MCFCAVGFAQKSTLKAHGVDNPVVYGPQQKAAVSNDNNASVFTATDPEGIYSRTSNEEGASQNLKRPSGAAYMGGNNPIFYQQRANAPVVYPVNENEVQAEILADQAYQANHRPMRQAPVLGANRPMADIIPTAGATETFTPDVGDHFFDPGGPGGSNSDGDPGNYPNCNCDTQTTLAGVTEIEFQEFIVFATFDYLRIYDGTDATGTLLYDNGTGGPNSGDITLADMIASNGSATFTSTSGNFFFFFHASSVVNRLGWDVEIIATSGGGGGTFPDPYCSIDFGTVEPITLVEVSDISNRSSEVIDGSPAHEDFTAIVGNMEEGQSYPIALEGNTNGGFTCSFTVFVDWDQDGVFNNAEERYEIGTIVGSTGTDGQQATGNITVPAGVADGPTRMRVVKKFGSTYIVDACTGTSWGQAEDYTIEVTGGGGGGTTYACDQDNPENNFENGFTTSSNQLQRIATDINVPADTDFTLEKMTFHIWTTPGETVDAAEITFYDNASSLPGAVRNTMSGVVPTSQTVIGNNFGFDISEVVFDITPEMLPGQTGMPTVYWVSLNIDISSGDGFLGSTSATIEGLNSAYSSDGGVTWNTNSGWDSVYVFEGQCEDIGGGGGICADPQLEVNQDVDDTCMADISQGGLAQSYTAVEDSAAGAGIKFRDPSTGLDVTLSLYDGLPNGGGTMLASGTAQTDGTNWVDVYWDPVVTVTPGSTYYLVIDGDTTLPCVAGSINNPYAGGMTYANNYSSFPNFDYTFRTYSCGTGGGGSGNPCAQSAPSNGFEDGKSFTKNLGRIVANDVTVAGSEDFTLETISINAFIGSTGSGVNADNVDVYIYEDAGGVPGSVITSEIGIVPASQTVIGSNFGYDLWEVEIDITDVDLLGQTGTPTTYWVGISLEPTDGSNTFWEYSSAGTIGYGLSYNDGTGFVTEPDNEGVYTFSGTCTPIIGFSNDDCDRAIAVSCGDTVTGSTVGANDSGGNAAPDVFFKFTGSGDAQLVTLSLCDGGTNFDSVLRVFDDCDLANEIAFNDDSCGTRSEVDFVSDGTSTYYIMVEGFGTNSGDFSLAVTCAEPLANDLCSGAIELACGDSVSGTTDGATIDSEAPTCGPSITSPGVWYTFNDTSGLPGDIMVSLCNGTTFDSKLSVYSGNDCSSLVCVGGNDDSCGLQSEYTFATDGNTKFYILVHSFGGATGDYTLDITCMPTPPPNDEIQNSIDVDEIGFPYVDPAVAMPAATTEDGNPQGCDLTGANGVWYNFTPTGDGTAYANIVTPGGASSVTFYTAPDENAIETDLVLVPNHNNQCVPGTSASITTEAGQAYYVFVMNTGAITDIEIGGTNLGVGDNTLEGFTYYPNPTSDVLNLNSSKNIEHVSIYSLLGQEVLSTKVNAASSTLDISRLSTGTYVMKVTVDGETGVYKIIKQ